MFNQLMEDLVGVVCIAQIAECDGIAEEALKCVAVQLATDTIAIGVLLNGCFIERSGGFSDLRSLSKFFEIPN